MSSSAIPTTGGCTWAHEGMNTAYRQYHDCEWGACSPATRKNGEALFELLCLEGQQSGLSWYTVFMKREAYRGGFHNFDPHKVAIMNLTKDVDVLLSVGTDKKSSQNVGTSKKEAPKPPTTVIRHRGKLEAIILNARAYISLTDAILKHRGTPVTSVAASIAFADYLWSFAYLSDSGTASAKTAKSRKAATAPSADAASGRPYFRCAIGLTKSNASPPTTCAASELMSSALKKAGFRFIGPTTCYAFMQAAGMVNDHTQGCALLRPVEEQRRAVFVQEDPRRLFTAAIALDLAIEAAKSGGANAPTPRPARASRKRARSSK